MLKAELAFSLPSHSGEQSCPCVLCPRILGQSNSKIHVHRGEFLLEVPHLKFWWAISALLYGKTIPDYTVHWQSTAELHLLACYRRRKIVLLCETSEKVRSVVEEFCQRGNKLEFENQYLLLLGHSTRVSQMSCIDYLASSSSNPMLSNLFLKQEMLNQHHSSL